MGERIDVLYDMTDSSGRRIARDRTRPLPPWAASAVNALVVAQEICQSHLDERTWAEFFFDSSRETVLLDIRAPTGVAGRYRVEVALAPRAVATRIGDAAPAAT